MMPESYLQGYQESEDTDDGTFLRALPGGKQPSQDQYYVAVLVAVALLYLVAVRRGFKGVLAA